MLPVRTIRAQQISDSVSVSEITTEGQFAALRDEWNELVESDGHATIFQTWEFQYHAWRIYADSVSPCLLLVRDEAGELIGCAPLGTNVLRVGPLSVRVLGFAPLKYCDYNNFILRGGREEETLAALASWFRENLHRWDVVLFRPVREDSSLVTCQDQFLGEIGRPYRVEECSTAPYLRLDAGWPSYEGALSTSRASSTRHKVSKLFRRFDGRFQQAMNGQLDEALDLFMGLHQKQWRDKDQLGAFAQPRAQEGIRALMKELSGRGLVKLHTIRSSEQTIATLCTFEFRGTVSYFQGGYDPDYGHLSPGTVMHALRITEALDQGAQEYDFLYGAEPYKFTWANGQRRMYSIEVGTGSWKRHLYHLRHRLRDRLSQSRLAQALYLRRIGGHHQGTGN